MTNVFPRGTGLPTAVAAVGAEIVDSTGRRYLDACGGAIVVNVGHGDESIISAMAEQARRVDYVHATQFCTSAMEEYAAELAPLVPLDDARIYPVSGGSEAIETALKLVRAYHLARGDADRHVIIARRGSYHGNSRGALDASGREPLRAPYLPWLGQTVHVPPLYPYRHPMTATEHAAALEQAIEQAGADRVGAFVAEPVAGAALGACVPPDHYWPAVAEVCERYGILLVADEVMTGFGRTGKWFACEHWGVRPDIVVCGKGASSGYWPLGLAIASGRVFETVRSSGGFVHGFTWSHHPIGAAVAHAVLRRLRDDGLVDRAATLGERLHATLRDALADDPHVGDVRGIGLLAGIELVRDKSTKEPFERAEQAVERVVAAAIARGLLVYPSTGCANGSDGDVVLLGPPFTITESQIDDAVGLTAASIATLRS